MKINKKLDMKKTIMIVAALCLSMSAFAGDMVVGTGSGGYAVIHSLPTKSEVKEMTSPCVLDYGGKTEEFYRFDLSSKGSVKVKSTEKSSWVEKKYPSVKSITHTFKDGSISRFVPLYDADNKAYLKGTIKKDDSPVWFYQLLDGEISIYFLSGTGLYTGLTKAGAPPMYYLHRKGDDFAVRVSKNSGVGMDFPLSPEVIAEFIKDNAELAASVKAEKKLPSKKESSLEALERIVREYNSAKEANK